MEKDNTTKTTSTTGEQKSSGFASCCQGIPDCCGDMDRKNEKEAQKACCGITISEEMLKMMEGCCRGESKKK